MKGQNYAEEIKARLTIYDLVSQYVQLKKAGVNWKGLCPFHSESTPSFVVSPEKQICHCFGCHKGGDIFSFIQEMEGVSFVESLTILGERVGIKVERTNMPTAGDNSEKDELLRSQEEATKFFEQQLWDTASGAKVLDYLKRRGVKEGDVKEFRLGFAPDSFELLTNKLLGQGFAKEVLLKTGLAATKDTGADGVYDKFRGRLMFPIFDLFGRVCGFGGRALSAEQMPKYLNSPDSVIYNKSKILYGFSHAKKAVKARQRVVLVEGYFDMILPYQVGVEETVATCGTALTADHVRLIKRFTTNVVSSFDRDNAGFEATKRSYFLLRAEGISLKVVSGLDEKDPADFVREHGADFGKLLDEAMPFVSFYIERLVKQFGTETLDGRKAVLAELLPIFKGIAPSEKDFFVRELSLKFKMAESLIYDEIERFALPSFRKVENELQVKEFRPSAAQCALAIMLKGPAFFVAESAEVFSVSENLDEKAIYNALADQYNSLRNELKSWDLSGEPFVACRREIDVLGLYADERYGTFREDELQAECAKLIARVRGEKSERVYRGLIERIKEAEGSGDMALLKSLLEEQGRLMSDLKK